MKVTLIFSVPPYLGVTVGLGFGVVTAELGLVVVAVGLVVEVIAGLDLGVVTAGLVVVAGFWVDVEVGRAQAAANDSTNTRTRLILTSDFNGHLLCIKTSQIE
ncbi:MAG: hypothetical protein HYX87_07715 [Chloroflexi bacterium]|nr:hypothetical protein [Chloroflexota bacterium]